MPDEVSSNKSHQPEPPWKGRFEIVAAVAGCVLAVPSFLDDLGPCDPLATGGCAAAVRFVQAHPWELTVVSGILLSSATARHILHAWARWGFAHADQAAARAMYPFYPELIRSHQHMLRIRARDVAREAGIPWVIAGVLMRNADFVPRPELLDGVCRAFLVRSEWIRQGGNYGPEYVERRLLWYHDRTLAYGWTKADILRMSADDQAATLSLIEDELRRALPQHSVRRAP